MRTLCLILLLHASLQLQCDKRNIIAHIGGEFNLICRYDTNRFLYSKKYWCRGNSRSTCTILLDSESKIQNTDRSYILDARRRGLILKVTNLQFEDSGKYWVGIDTISADTMISVNVVITEVPVSKPRLQPLSSLADRLTCWGRPVAVRCGCTEGTGVGYVWYRRTHHNDLLIHNWSDLDLQCGTVRKDSEYYCIASNDISSQESDVLSVQVLMPADRSCIYVITLPGQPFYNCDDRMSTATATPPPLTTCQATVNIHSDSRNTSLPINQTDQDPVFSRAWAGVPLWYTLLRWCSFVSILIFMCIILKCTKARYKSAKSAKRRRRV